MFDTIDTIDSSMRTKFGTEVVFRVVQVKNQHHTASVSVIQLRIACQRWIDSGAVVLRYQ